MAGSTGPLWLEAIRRRIEQQLEKGVVVSFPFSEVHSRERVILFLIFCGAPGSSRILSRRAKKHLRLTIFRPGHSLEPMQN